jgi:sugar phosphate isomerase/epimerase
VPIGLSTASVWPLRANRGFELAAELGYDGVEVMVWADPSSQDAQRLRGSIASTGVPVLAVHSPSLLITQRVWSPDPIVRLRRSVDLARELGASTVVVHPPFRWQPRYGEIFSDLLLELEEDSGIRLAVENMFAAKTPGRRGARFSAFRPSPDPTEVGYRHYTLDISHAAAEGQDVFALAKRMGEGLTHLHLADSSGISGDEHLVPGRGDQPCARLLETLAAGGFAGQVVVEVNTRRVGSAQRAKDLAEALLFAQLHLSL